MPVTHVTHDLDTLTLTLVAEFDAPVARLWEVYADPRQLEQIWGTPEYPATFVEHSLTPGGISHYYMTGPDGSRHYSWWEVESVDAPHSFTFADGFALDDTFARNPEMPVSHAVYSFAPLDGGRTRATYLGRYESAEALHQVLEMGVVDGATAAINQIDGFLRR